MGTRLLAATLFVVIVGACGPAPSPSADPGSPDPAGGPPDATRYTCGSYPFDASAWQRAGTAEQAGHPAAAALRAHLAVPDPDHDLLPEHGWTLVGMDATGAEFLAPGGDDLMFEVQLTQQGGAWSVAGWGECRPKRVLPAGLHNATWMLAPGLDVNPATTGFTALVTELECASGQSSDGRIVGPEIRELTDEVLVTFAVRDPGGDSQTCQSNPATTVEVQLPQPLGQRRLLDGATLPAGDPAER